MSYSHVDKVINYSKTKGPARAVLLVLAHRANDRDLCWPSLSRIKSDAGIARNTTLSAIRKAVKLGELLVFDRKGTANTKGGLQASNLYRITIKGSAGAEPPDNAKVVQELTQGSAGAEPKYSLESSIKPPPPTHTFFISRFRKIQRTEFQSKRITDASIAKVLDGYTDAITDSALSDLERDAPGYAERIKTPLKLLTRYLQQASKPAKRGGGGGGGKRKGKSNRNSLEEHITPKEVTPS